MGGERQWERGKDCKMKYDKFIVEKETNESQGLRSHRDPESQRYHFRVRSMNSKVI